eukprot:evm.model.scf_128EXC.15 EVM.evm.TU.scf_128EXC.15   scf_128EXC:111893-115442(+)
MERAAERRVQRMADDHSRALDDPVVAYLAGLIAGHLEEGAPEGDLEDIVDTFSSFFERVEGIGASVRSMVADLQAAMDCMSDGSLQEASSQAAGHGQGPMSMEPCTSRDTTSTQTLVEDVRCTMGGKSTDLVSMDTVSERPVVLCGKEVRAEANSLAKGRTLNINAKEFVPGSLDLSGPVVPPESAPEEDDAPGTADADVYSQDLPSHLSSLVQRHTISKCSAEGACSLDADLKTLSFLFPERSTATLEALLTAHDGNLQAAVWILGGLASEGSVQPVAPGTGTGCPYSTGIGGDVVTASSSVDDGGSQSQTASISDQTFQKQSDQHSTAHEGEPSAKVGLESPQEDSILWSFLNSSQRDSSLEAGLEMLSFLFPECSGAALEDVLAANNGNVQDAIRMVTRSEGIAQPHALGAATAAGEDAPQNFSFASVGMYHADDIITGSWDEAELGSCQHGAATQESLSCPGAGEEHSQVTSVTDSSLQEQHTTPGSCQCRSVDADMDLLSCLFPEYSGAALEKLLSANNGNVQDTARVLRGLRLEDGGQPLASGTGPSHFHIPRMDLGEDMFPALPGAQAGLQQAQHWEQGKLNFVEIVKKIDKPIEGDSWPKGTGAIRRHVQQEKRSMGRSAPAVPWVETGEAVSQQYAGAREEAAHFARLRNKCFMEATKAYLSGNKSAAKHLGAEGRRYGARMKELHEGASEAIFRQRNQDLSVSRGRKGPLVVDFHGLHVSEAVRILERELERMSSEKPAGQVLTVNLIVGTGHHTKGSRTPSRLPAAIEQSLSWAGYTWRQSKPGLLEVKLK